MTRFVQVFHASPGTPPRLPWGGMPPSSGTHASLAARKRMPKRRGQDWYICSAAQTVQNGAMVNPATLKFGLVTRRLAAALPTWYILVQI